MNRLVHRYNYLVFGMNPHLNRRRHHRLKLYRHQRHRIAHVLRILHHQLRRHWKNHHVRRRIQHFIRIYSHNYRVLGYSYQPFARHRKIWLGGRIAQNRWRTVVDGDQKKTQDEADDSTDNQQFDQVDGSANEQPLDQTDGKDKKTQDETDGRAYWRARRRVIKMIRKIRRLRRRIRQLKKKKAGSSTDNTKNLVLKGAIGCAAFLLFYKIFLSERPRIVREGRRKQRERSFAERVDEAIRRHDY